MMRAKKFHATTSCDYYKHTSSSIFVCLLYLFALFFLGRTATLASFLYEPSSPIRGQLSTLFHFPSRGERQR